MKSFEIPVLGKFYERKNFISYVIICYHKLNLKIKF